MMVWLFPGVSRNVINYCTEWWWTWRLDMSMPFMPNNTLINDVVSVTVCVRVWALLCVCDWVSLCVCSREHVCVSIFFFFWNISFVHVTYRSLCFCVNSKIWHSTHWKNIGVKIPWDMRVLCCSCWMGNISSANEHCRSLKQMIPSVK